MEISNLFDKDRNIYQKFLYDAVNGFIHRFSSNDIEELVDCFGITSANNSPNFHLIVFLSKDIPEEDKKKKADKLSKHFDKYFAEYVSMNQSQWDGVITTRGIDVNMDENSYNSLRAVSGVFNLKRVIEDTEKAKLKDTKKPEDVRFILQRLNDNGHSAYVVGGCVRDASMQRDPHDWDITTSAKPDEVEQIFADHKIIETGLKHGTVTVMRNGEGYEITTYRIDGDYSDGRHPDSVNFTDNVVEDLKRRDFTMNAIALDNRGEVVDPFDGCADIYNQTVRAVGNPRDRFDEDALRIMRAIRFSVVFGFEIDNNTKDAVLGMYQRLGKVSKERIQAELVKMGNSPKFPDALEEFREVFDFIFDNDDWVTPRKVANEDLITKFAYMFNTAEEAERIITDLKFDSYTRDCVVELVQNKNKPIHEDSKPDIRAWLNVLGEEQLLRLGAIRGIDLTKIINDCRGDCYTYKDLTINGNDVLSLGYKGKEVGEALKGALWAVINDKVANNKEDLIKYIKETYKLKGE